MKTNTTTRPTPRRRTRHLPTAHRFRPTENLQQQPTQRRLYTDFLALAFYPGMNPRDHDSAA